jgi:hypothetical protein
MENNVISEEEVEYNLFLNKVFWAMVDAGIYETNARTYLDMLRDMKEKQNGIYSFVFHVDRKMISDYIYMEGYII